VGGGPHSKVQQAQVVHVVVVEKACWLINPYKASSKQDRAAHKHSTRYI